MRVRKQGRSDFGFQRNIVASAFRVMQTERMRTRKTEEFV